MPVAEIRIKYILRFFFVQRWKPIQLGDKVLVRIHLASCLTNYSTPITFEDLYVGESHRSTAKLVTQWGSCLRLVFAS